MYPKCFDLIWFDLQVSFILYSLQLSDTDNSWIEAHGHTSENSQTATEGVPCPASLCSRRKNDLTPSNAADFIPPTRGWERADIRAPLPERCKCSITREGSGHLALPALWARDLSLEYCFNYVMLRGSVDLWRNKNKVPCYSTTLTPSSEARQLIPGCSYSKILWPDLPEKKRQTCRT